MSNWYEEMEQAEQEHEAKLEDDARAYKEGYEQGRADEREKVLDEFRKRIDEHLNESSDFADFIVTDGAIDTVIEQLKEQDNEKD